MIKLDFPGFNNVHSQCEYDVGNVRGKKAIIFYQKTLVGTSITNKIESLTMHVLATELPGIDPKNVRVFEHHNPDLEPIYEWAEVQFSDSGMINENKSIIRKLVEFISPSGVLPKYYVNGPRWSNVLEQDIELLAEIK